MKININWKKLDSIIPPNNKSHNQLSKFHSIPHQILPPTVVDDIKKGKIVQVEYFDAVTICFLDIVKFVAMIADYSPVQVVTLLNNLYK